MCTIEHIDKLIEAGIDSFKIEGRMKKPEYTAGVTAIYRKYIDAYYKYGHSVKVSEEDMKVLTSLYIRSERETGYYFRRNGKEMVSLNNPAYSGSDEKILQKIRNDYLQRMPKMAINMNFIQGHLVNLLLYMVMIRLRLPVLRWSRHKISHYQ